MADRSNKCENCFFTVCGPKGSVCCAIFSTWGIIMLILLGIFYKIQAVSLFEDLGLHESATNPLQRANVTLAYDNAAYACWGAAGIYAAFFVFSVTMAFINIKYRQKPKAQ